MQQVRGGRGGCNLVMWFLCTVVGLELSFHMGWEGVPCWCAGVCMRLPTLDEVACLRMYCCQFVVVMLLVGCAFTPGKESDGPVEPWLGVCAGRTVCGVALPGLVCVQVRSVVLTCLGALLEAAGGGGALSQEALGTLHSAMQVGMCGGGLISLLCACVWVGGVACTCACMGGCVGGRVRMHACLCVRRGVMHVCASMLVCMCVWGGGSACVHACVRVGGEGANAGKPGCCSCVPEGGPYPCKGGPISM